MQWPLGGISHPARRVLRGWGARVWVVCTCSPSLVQSITPSGLLCGLGCTSRGQEEGDQISLCPWRSQPGWAMAPDRAVPTSRAARADVLLQTRLSRPGGCLRLALCWRPRTCCCSCRGRCVGLCLPPQRGWKDSPAGGEPGGYESRGRSCEGPWMLGRGVGLCLGGLG